MPLSRLTSPRLPAWLIGGNSVVMLLVIALAWTSLSTSRGNFQDSARHAATNVAHGVAQAIGARLDRVDMALRAIALGYEEGADALATTQRLRRQSRLVDGLALLFIADPQGQVESRTGPAASENAVSEKFFALARDSSGQNLHMGGLKRSADGRWELILARRLARADGTFGGVAFARVPVGRIEEVLGSVNVDKEGALILRLMPSMELVARRPAAEGIGVGTVFTTPEQERQLERHPDTGHFVAVLADKVERLVAYQRIAGYPLLVLVGLGTSDVLAPWRSELAVTLVLCLLSALLLAALTALVLHARRREIVNRMAMQATETFLDRTGRIAAVGGWELDLDSGVVTWSDQTCRLLDMPTGQRPHIDAALQFVDREAREDMRSKLENGKPGSSWVVDIPLVTAKGRPLWGRVMAEVVGEDGRARRVVGAVQDITEQRNNQVELAREQALRTQIEAHARELDSMVSERGEMLDVLAHEVRQPLNNASAALQSAAEVLSELDEHAASQRLARAQLVLNQVLGRLDNTLAVASLLARPDPIAREDADVDALVAVAVADMPAEQRARVQVGRATLTRTASMDMSLMRLALRNLLSNALRHGPPGSAVWVRLSDSDQPLALVIEVSDSGPGIPAAMVPRLFERGARGSAHSHGLGLYIVRRVMELHDGRVELVHNEPGHVTMRLVVVQEPAD